MAGKKLSFYQTAKAMKTLIDAASITNMESVAVPCYVKRMPTDKDSYIFIYPAALNDISSKTGWADADLFNLRVTDLSQEGLEAIGSEAIEAITETALTITGFTFGGIWADTGGQAYQDPTGEVFHMVYLIRVLVNGPSRI